MDMNVPWARRPIRSRARVEPPFPRKALFENLEQRLLLAGDPVTTFPKVYCGHS
jgi:hypothetical protein